jgi:hypothetical protein
MPVQAKSSPTGRQPAARFGRMASARLLCFHGSPLVRTDDCGTMYDQEPWGDIESERALLEEAVSIARARVSVRIVIVTRAAVGGRQ